MAFSVILIKVVSNHWQQVLARSSAAGPHSIKAAIRGYSLGGQRARF